MRFRTRTLMKTVAAAAVALGMAHHVWATIRTGDGFAGAIFSIEGMGVAVLLAIGLATRKVVGVVRKDDAHAVRLRRGVLPDRCPIGLTGRRSPES